jgi:type II secretory pathway pseudopilin PulG
MDRRQVEGFSLLELVITIAILTTATLTAMLLLVPVARESRVRREVQIANLAAKRALERIQTTPFNDIVDAYPQGYAEPVAWLPSGALTVQYVDPTADPLSIQVTMSWVSGEVGAMSRTFSTVRTE